MDKEKEIEMIAEIITNSAFNDMSDSRSRHKYGVSGFYAEALINAGYGNVKQAVKDFAEKLKKEIVLADDIDLFPHYSDGYNRACGDVVERIDTLFKELYGCCETCPNNNNAEYDERTCPMWESCGRK